jgi:uncharacterized membrane protein YtjA (UPF0391 family)
LADDLTAVIPPRRHPPARSPAPILFLRKPPFSSFPARGGSGTFVPITAYFSNPGAATSAARMSKQNVKNRGRVMLSWVVTFLIIALIAGVLGFGGIAGVSIEIAKTIFFIAVVLFLISAVVGLARGRTNV